MSLLLGNNELVAFVGVKDAGRAKAFYRDKLGLELKSEDPFALVFEAKGTRLHVAIVPEVALANYTVLGWRVADIQATMKLLDGRGVRFERFDFLGQDKSGVWKAPGGTRVAWFRDPDGNLLSLSQDPD